MALSDDEFIEIYRNTVERLFRFVATRAGQQGQVVEDIVQETYLRAVNAWSESKPDIPLAWLYTVAGNLLRNYFRNQKPVNVAFCDLEKFLTNPVNSEAHQSAELVNWGLGQLKNDRAEILQQFYFDRLTMAEIGERRGLTQKAVERRLAKARADLRKRLAKFVKK